MTRVCHPLSAEDTVLRISSERFLKCVEADAAFYGHRSTALERKFKRKPTRHWLKTLVKRTEAATGRKACGVTYSPDGSRTVQVGEIGEAEATPPAELSPLELWRLKHAH
jgi:hypothetical protein